MIGEQPAPLSADLSAAHPVPFERWLASISLRQLEIFAAVARELSFVHAAHKLQLSQATVSGQLQLLERIIGTPLVSRSRGSRYIALTDAGRILFTRYGDVVRALEQASMDIAALRYLATGTVRVGSSPLAGNYIVPAVLAEFTAIHPQINVDLRVGWAGTILADMAQARVDLAILFGSPPPTSHGLVWERLRTFDVVPIGPATHRLAGRHGAPLQELAQEPLIYSGALAGPESSPIGDLLDRLARQHNLKLWWARQIMSDRGRMEAVARGLGVTVLPTFCLEAPMAGVPPVVALPVEGFPLQLDFSVVVRPGPLTPTAEAFRGYLRRWAATSLTAEGTTAT